MKILYTMTAYPPSAGGAQQHFHEIARRLAAQDDVTVVRQWQAHRTDWLLGTTVLAPKVGAQSLDGVSVRGLPLTVGDRVKVLPALPLFYALPQLFTPWVGAVLLTRLRQQLSGSRPEVIHHGRIGRESLAWASLRLARELEVPFVLTPFHHPRWTGWRYRQWLQLYRQADGLCALTQSEQQTLISLGVRPERIRVVGHGPSVLEPSRADPLAFRRRHGLADHPVVLSLGQKYRYKGYGQLWDAAPRVWRRFPQTRFVFLGPRTPESEAFFRVHRDPRVLELPTVGDEEKCSALAACDILCLPSTQESFGGENLEAWVYSKPVVGCRIPAVSEVIDGGQNGLLVDQEGGSIAEALLELLEDPGKARSLGQRGKQKVLSQFDWAVIAERVRAFYLELRANPRR